MCVLRWPPESAYSVATLNFGDMWPSAMTLRAILLNMSFVA